MGVAMQTPMTVVADVKYQFFEYMQVVRDRLDDTQGGQARWYDWWIDTFALPAFLSLLFVIKTNRVGRCTFTIDTIGITRSSKNGTFTSTWSEIDDIKRYRTSYLVILSGDEGAMPLPFRTLSVSQLRAVDAWIALLRASRGSG